MLLLLRRFGMFQKQVPVAVAPDGRVGFPLGVTVWGNATGYTRTIPHGFLLLPLV